jgi:hypothetical protein
MMKEYGKLPSNFIEKNEKLCLFMNNKALYNWLQYQWIDCNPPKYQHLFKEWVANLTETQIKGFEKMRTRLKH